MVLLAILLHKNYLIAIGVWHYVKVTTNIYSNPSFNLRSPSSLPSSPSSPSSSFVASLVVDNARIYEFEPRSWPVRVWLRTKAICILVAKFGLKLAPVYLKKIQKNQDLRNNKDEPAVAHNAIKVKPGKSYFTHQFFVMIVMVFYFLFFYRNVTGESKSGSISTVSL